MDGFYYDAEIEHITEVIKNVLYFAVLKGEDNRKLKNTRDILYFSIDDELLYFNYYFDFGPLNISCLYKYCCKLKNYLHCVHSSKRVVHYTTSNATRKVNAAFLIGCYSVIYLQASPNDIYKKLLHAGGPFKQFVDASQGVSQSTINILDCFRAIHKAKNYNFFNFCDFNVAEYDTYDKLQNGDMNWLLPRKFLAFIGPTDNIIQNGRPPDDYIQYFLENDIKTVIRLNNKVYDSSVFTNAGIEHYELYFPDGTIPTKQILLRFLNLSESACASIAVHCKAGLGRTGSLIGAYIIKHYRMTAHEAIAWMRICRPGSVIGQQQGWLEKIETWLWRQGNNFRMQHFGDGDKIVHHKYGIYSKSWTIARERLIRHVQKRRLETATLRNGIQAENVKRFTNSDLPPQRCTYYNITQTNSSKNRSVPKIPTTLLKNEENKVKPKLFHKGQRTDYNLNNMSIKNNLSCVREISNCSVKPKRLLSTFKFNERSMFDTNSTPKNEASQRSVSQNSKPYQLKWRKRNQSECREQFIGNKTTLAVEKEYVHNLEQTQGDKLNEIKAKRISDYFRKVDKQNKPENSTKKVEISMKRSHGPIVYSTRI